MRHPASQRTVERYRQIYRDPDLAGLLGDYELIVGGRNLTVQELRYYTEEPPAPGMTLEATVPQGVYTPPEEGSHVTVNLGPRGSAKMRTFTGRLLRPVRDGETLTLIAVSPGYYHERLNYYRLFGQLAEFSGRNPSDVVHETLAKTRLYQGMNIPIIDEPLYSASGEEGFDFEATIGQILESVRDASGLWVFDDGRAFARGMTLDKLEEPGEAVATWEVGKHIISSTFVYAVRDEERYRDVTVYQMTIDEPTPLLGSPSNLDSQFVDVPYRSPRSRPPLGVSLPLQVEGADAASALGLAFRTAGSLNAGAYNWEFQTPFIDPRYERGDTLAWEETVFEEGLRVERLWRGVIGRIEHNPTSGTALYAGVGNIYHTDTAVYAADTLETGLKSVGVVG